MREHYTRLLSARHLHYARSSDRFHWVVSRPRIPGDELVTAPCGQVTTHLQVCRTAHAPHFRASVKYMGDVDVRHHTPRGIFHRMNISRWTLRSALAFAVLALGSLRLAAQQTTGSIGGRVTAANGQGLGDVQIVVTNTETGLNVSGKTRTDGNYLIPGLE